MRYRDYINGGQAVVLGKLMMHNIGAQLPYRLNMNITNLCNSKCHTCGVWQIYHNDPGSLRDEMTVRELDKLFKGLPDLLWFSFAGGEPFLRNDFAEIVASAVTNCPSLIVVDTSTNGLLPETVERETLKVLEEYGVPLFGVGVSIDGTSDIHDRIRGIPGGWKTSIETYQRLVKVASRYHNFSTHVNYTLSDFNIGKMGEFLKVMDEEGVEPRDISVSLAHSGVAFSNESLTNMCITDIGQAVHDLELLSMAQNRGGLKLPEIRPMVKNIFVNLARTRYLRNPQRLVIPCAAMTASCFLDPYGNVLPCTIWDMKMGNIREHDYSLSNIWYSDNAEAARESIKVGACPNCWSGCESWASILQNMPWTSRFLKQR